MDHTELFERFRSYYVEMRNYAFAAARIHWDMETAAPKKAIKESIQVLTFLRSRVFRMSTAPEYGEMLQRLSEP